VGKNPTDETVPTARCSGASACGDDKSGVRYVRERNAFPRNDFLLLMSTALHVDLDLIRRYNRRGPRYTSYPTAPHFAETYDDAAFADDLRATTTAPLSLYVHLPFCRSLCSYCGCHMRVTQRPQTIERYLAMLKREIDALAERVATGRRVVQIHWGGGTPTYLTPAQIRDLGTHLQDRFDVAPGAEISLEADPRGLTEAHVAAAASVGFTRISFGVQDATPEVQAAIRRVQPTALVAQGVRWARQHGFESVNFDLVYGLPHQTAERFEATLDVVDALRPDRLALYSYAHVPSVKPHQRLIPDDALPAPDEKLRIFKMATERLTGAGGYRFIGMDHFARPGDALAVAQDEGTLHRNFQGYSTHADAEILAMGVSGISQLEGAYAQNVKGLRDYYACIDAGRPTVYRGLRLTPEDRLRRHVIMQLMCDFHLDLPTLEARFRIDAQETFADAFDALAQMEADGLVTLTPRAVHVQPPGRLLIRNVAMAFDAYRSTERQQPVHAQTV